MVFEYGINKQQKPQQKRNENNNKKVKKKVCMYTSCAEARIHIFMHEESLNMRHVHVHVYFSIIYIGCQVSYILLYLEESLIYSYIWKTVLYIPIFQGKREMLNSYLKQMLLISNMERCKNSHFYQVRQPCTAQPSHYRFIR